MKVPPVFTIALLVSILAASVEAKPKQKTPKLSPVSPSESGDTGASPEGGLISSEISGKDLQFFTSAHDLGETQVWLGEQAAKAESDEIKAVGGALKASQSDEDRLVAQVAAHKGVHLQAGNHPNAQVQQLTAQLAKLKGPKFDKAVIDQILAVNQQEVAAYEAATQSKDLEIKKLAEQLLPLAKEKLQLAEKMTGTAPRTNVTPTFRTANPSETEKQ